MVVEVVKAVEVTVEAMEIMERMFHRERVVGGEMLAAEAVGELMVVKIRAVLEMVYQTVVIIHVEAEEVQLLGMSVVLTYGICNLGTQ
jgi:hypothetical protein